MSDRIGFIGLGRLGSAMVTRLCETGPAPRVWNRDHAKSARLTSHGAIAVQTPRDLVAESDLILCCIHDGAAVEEVLFGASGAASGRAAGKVFVDMSTIGPDATRRLAARLFDACAMTWVDAPVSGGVPAAETGKLVVMAGGTPADIERVRPVLERLSQRITRIGEVGTGQAVKAINQMLVGGYVAVVAEGLSLAERYGLEVNALPDILKGGLADSNILQNQGRRMAVTPMERAGSAAIMIKDLDIATSMATTLSQTVPVASLVAQLYRLQTGVGYDEFGMIGLMRLFRGEPQPRS
jgi:3-hydroxyisobutyrate dehydrogenase